MHRLLIANRGEVAVRIARAAASVGVDSVAIFTADDTDAPHTRHADSSVALPGTGPAGYLDIGAVIAAAEASGCDALHPGYGLLAESAALGAACERAGIAFVGPAPHALAMLGDKVAARELAAGLGISVLPGRSIAGLAEAGLEEARTWFDEIAGGGAVMLKAVAGGGGRGMRIVAQRDELDQAWDRCSGEASAAFGNGALFLERFVTGARHVEIQVVADAAGSVITLGERECSLQRRHQKLIEFTPAPSLTPDTRAALSDAAARLASAAGYRGLGTVEFLVDGDGSWYFIEVNPRLQVEHTITEEVYGVDLVATQLRLTAGATLAELGLTAAAHPRGRAIQLRVNAEIVDAAGNVRPAGGIVRSLSAPGGPGVRLDGALAVGSGPNPRFDTLLAKVVVHVRDGAHVDLLVAARRALGELLIDGVTTNAGFLDAMLAHPEVRADRISTRFVDEHLGELVASSSAAAAAPVSAAPAGPADPLAVLAHGKAAVTATRSGPERQHDGPQIAAPMPGTIVSVAVAVGQHVAAGTEVAVMEAMKMEHVITAPSAVEIVAINVTPGQTVAEGETLIVYRSSDDVGVATAGEDAVDLEVVRPDLAEVLARQAITRDEARPEAVAKRRAIPQRTARENIADLIDEGSFVEYGSLVLAAQRRRRPLDDLIQRTPADGMVAGLATVNADLFGPDAGRAMVLSYDYMVLAGTQGLQNHRKKDRMFELAERMRTPVVFFTEGGGGRPGDTDGMGVAGLDCRAFGYFAQLSGLVPLVGVNAGRCFAGNAAILGCCDVVIATRHSSIGMGGPAMIEGGGLGVFHPDEVGPTAVQAPSGVIDVLVDDDAEAVAVAKRYLSYFQGPTAAWEAADQRRLRHIVPENRLRVYDVRQVVETLADTGSVLELRRHFGAGMVTALARLEGRPVGIIANNPTHLAGAIDSDGADKAARFMQLCDAFDVPIVFLCDTPGMMVGPEVERTALVRHCSRLFVTGASLTVPFVTIVLRKGYGLGAQAMAGGSFHAPLITVGWPTSEFGGMGLEGAVKLGYRNELAAIADPEERATAFAEMVERMYQIGKGVNMASHFEIDDVIDPADTRRVITGAFRSVAPPPPRLGKKRPMIDTW